VLKALHTPSVRIGICTQLNRVRMAFLKGACATPTVADLKALHEHWTSALAGLHSPV